MFSELQSVIDLSGAIPWSKSLGEGHYVLQNKDM